MKKIVSVETISIFKHYYVVEVEQKENESDNDFMRRAEKYISENSDPIEFGQIHLGEMISGSSVLTKEEYIQNFDLINDYLKDAPLKNKESYITKIDN